ncbi:kelch domain-containing protein 3, partial [Tachysurus ichikawai]
MLVSPHSLEHVPQFVPLLLNPDVSLQCFSTLLVSELKQTVTELLSPCAEQGMGDEFNLMDHSDLYILDFCPNLKTLCKLAVIHYSLEQSGLPHDIRWELAAMTTNSTISRPIFSSHG